MDTSPKKRALVRYKPIDTLTIQGCYIRATLDTRHNDIDPDHRYSVAIIFHLSDSGKNRYINLPYKFTKEEYMEVASSTGRGKKVIRGKTPYEYKLAIQEEFTSWTDKLRAFAKHETVTTDLFERFMSKPSGESFYEFWGRYSDGKSENTQNITKSSRKSFIKHVKGYDGQEITEEMVKRWKEGMTAEGRTTTTQRYYIQSCKSARYEAIKKGIIENGPDPFGKLPPSRDRKRRWLDVDKMTRLYDMFIEGTLPFETKGNEAEHIRFTLGLFLFMYLGNGCNLADVAELTYNDLYYATGGKALSFIRQKTLGRNFFETMIPITEPLSHIIDRICAKPQSGGRLFPTIYGDSTTQKEKIRKKNTTCCNMNLRLKRITDAIGWDVKLSATWARHSFATNLTHAGIPDRYISEAMGHSLGSTTSNYIDIFPLTMQLEYNSKLLKVKNPETTKREVMITIPMREYRELLEEKNRNGMK